MVLLAASPQLAAVAELYSADGQYNENDALSSFEVRAGDSISHDRIIEIAKHIRLNPEVLDGRYHNDEPLPRRLDDLLRGCAVYILPPKVKAEPTKEYKALMARLRADEEARQYERMVNPAVDADLFSQRYPRAKYGDFTTIAADPRSVEEDDITYADVNRQLALIANVLISVVCCAVALWMAAKRWSTPSRLFLSMAGSLLVAVAEVVIYSGYIRRLSEAKTQERKKVERKTVSNSWVSESRQRDKKPLMLEPLGLTATGTDVAKNTVRNRGLRAT